MFPISVNGILSLMAPNFTWIGLFTSFSSNAISGIPFKAKTNASSLIISNLLIVSGINFSKFFTSHKKSKSASADF